MRTWVSAKSPAGSGVGGSFQRLLVCIQINISSNIPGSAESTEIGQIQSQTNAQIFNQRIKNAIGFRKYMKANI